MLFALIRGIRSSRQIEYSLKHSIDFIWLASGRTIDHTTLSEFRRKHQAELKGLYRDLVQLAVDLKVAQLGELCIDGTRVQADANKYRTWTADKAEKLLQELDGRIEAALAELGTNDKLDELFDTGQKSDELPADLREMQARRTQVDEAYKKLLDMEKTREKWGADSKKNPAQLPKADTDSRMLPNKEGGYAPNYTPMIVTETANGFIVGVDVVIGNVEHHQLATLIDVIASDYDVDIARMLADRAYTTGENLVEMEARNVEMLGPLAEPQCIDNPAHREDLTQPVEEAALDKLPINPQTKRFDKSAFVYDAELDYYYCPAGEPMARPAPRHRDEDGAPIEPKTKTFTTDACATCGIVSRCRLNPEARGGRQINDDIHEPARRRHRERMSQEASKIEYGKRFHYGEVPFAVLKTVMGFRRFLLRGEEGVQTEWLWACTGYNLKKLIKLWPEICAANNENQKTAVA